MEDKKTAKLSDEQMAQVTGGSGGGAGGSGGSGGAGAGIGGSGGSGSAEPGIVETDSKEAGTHYGETGRRGIV